MMQKTSSEFYYNSDSEYEHDNYLFDDYSDENKSPTLLKYTTLLPELSSKRFETILNDTNFYFGYLVKKESSLEFYVMLENTNCYFFIEETKYAVIYSKQNNDIIKLNYSLKENIPSVFINDSNNLTDDNCCDLFIIFPDNPKILENSTQIISKNLKTNFNIHNNFLSLDCIYRSIYLKNFNKNDFQKLMSCIYLNLNLRKINSECKIKVYNENEFFNLVVSLNEYFTKLHFEDLYQIFVDICKGIKNSHFIDIDAIKERQKENDRKFYSENSNYFRIKSVQISTNNICFRKPSLHSTSRFLRTYFNNEDNFIKIEFLDNKIEELVDFIFKEGLTIGNKTYEFFITSNNNIKSGSFWMVDKNYVTNVKSKSQIYSEIGLNEVLLMENLSFAKKLARIGQNFTGTYSFKEDIHNIKINHIEDVINNEYIFSDGCGKISANLITKICNKLNNYVPASAIQIRYKGVKGVLVTDNNMKNFDIEFTKSMVKFNLNTPFFNDLEIIRFSSFSQGHLNLQIIILFIFNGADKKHILKLANKQTHHYQNINLNNSEVRRIVEEMKIDKNKFDKNCFSFFSKSALYSYTYNKLSSMKTKFRIKVKHSAFLLGVFDFDNLLQENEIFVQIQKKPNSSKKLIKGTAVITKNPCLSVYDLQKVTCVDVEQYHHLVNVIVFPSKGKIPLAYKICNSDLDGDVFFLTWDKNLIKIKQRDFSEKFTNEIKIETRTFTTDFNSSVEESMIKYFNFFQSNNKLGKINAIYNKISNRLLKGNKYESQITEKLATYNSIEVDFCKSGTTCVLDDHDNILKGQAPDFLLKDNERNNYNYFLFLLNKLTQSSQENHLEFVKDVYNNIINSLQEDKNIKTEFSITNKYLKLFEFTQRQNNKKQFQQYSSLYQIYSSINISKDFHKAFYYSLLPSCKKYFQENIYNNDNLVSQIISIFNPNRQYNEIIKRIKDVFISYSNNIKSIMMEQDILFESELIYWMNLKKPLKKQNDELEWKRAIKNEVDIVKTFALQNLLSIESEFTITREEIKTILFIILFWNKEDKLPLNDNLNSEFENYLDCYTINDIDSFLEEIFNKKNYEAMKKFYLYNLKIVSLLEIY